MPSVLWSDNAKVFIAGSERLPQTFGPLAPKWKFIVPRSPWWGGWWERLVRSVKSGLKKTLKQRCLTCTELETLLHEVEACINSRPLTFVGDNLEDRRPLTPANFIVGQSNLFTPQRLDGEEASVNADQLRERLEVKNTLLEQFWRVWTKEYLRHLPQQLGKGGHPRVQVGDLVVIREDNIPRLMWPLGRIEEVYEGKDGIVRSCKLRVKTKSMVRPIQRLYNLEVDGPGEDFEKEPELDLPQNDVLRSDTNVQSTASDSQSRDDGLTDTQQRLYVSKYGRVVKPPTKL